jgi:ribonuclease BN (tRNA processing enzyme)
MKIRVLGCAGTVSPESKTSAFLINDDILLDGGTICSSLSMEELEAVRTIFISHPHFDHIKGIPSLAETLIFVPDAKPVTILGSDQAIESIRTHIMNNIIWPDFSALPTVDRPVISYRKIPEGVPVEAGKITVTPFFLNNNLTDFGYLVKEGNRSLLYTSDIGPEANLTLNGQAPDSVIIEVSFPNEKEDLAQQTCHLTPLLLLKMLHKLPVLPANIFVSHLKTYYKEQIVAELHDLGLSNLVILNDGDILQL